MQMPHGEPADLAAHLERGAPVQPGPGDRFVGYAVMGLPFAGGDVLALRRFPITSVGSGYTSVWHRAPDGHWTFYADVPAHEGCTRYWGGVVDDAVVAPIRVEWTGGRTLTVSVDGGRLVSWSLRLASTPAASMMNAVAARMPAALWQRPWFLRVVSTAARALLGTGRLRLAGHTPSGHRFLSNPFTVWTIAASRATVAGRDLGPVGATPRQAALGEFLVPQRGLFAVGAVSMQPTAASEVPK